MSRHAKALDVVVRAARGQRPGMTIGTDRVPIDPDSDHTAWLKDNHGIGVCRAADFMVYGDKSAGDRLAANLAAKLGKHPAMGHGAYVIWYQRIMSYDRLGEGWRTMEDRGSTTANHKDHVHLSITLNQAGYDYTGSWGALFTGRGTGAAATPAGPSALDTSPTGAADTRPAPAGVGGGTGSPGGYGVGAATGAVNAGLGLPGIDLDDVANGVVKLVVVGGALVLGTVLVALGAARASRPARKAVNDAGAQAATLALPELRAAGAATTATSATKGTS